DIPPTSQASEYMRKKYLVRGSSSRNTGIAWTLFLCLFSLVFFPTWCIPPTASAQQVTIPIQNLPPNYRTEEIPVIKNTYPLYSLLPERKADQVKLTGLYPSRSFWFYSQRNEMISKAQLTLKYTPSPSLIPVQSQLNVYLNGQMQMSLPITEDQLGKPITQTIDFSPKVIEDSNKLDLEFVGQYAQICGNVANPTIWRNLDESSYVTLNIQKLRLNNELATFPAPFVSINGPASTNLPFWFASNPSNDIKKAAGMVASWIGTKTEWKGANFPVYIGEFPSDQDFIAFITQDRRPDFLNNEDPFTGPTILVRDAPDSLSSKVFIIAGTNDREVAIAAQWLAESSASMIGSWVDIKDFKPLPNRAAYDAPNWIKTGGKVELASLTRYNGQLRSTGIRPIPITLEIRLPPDLFMVNRSDVKVDLKYRYTKPVSGEPAQMRFLLNDQLVDSFTLDPEQTGSSFTSQFSLLNGLAGLWDNTAIPGDLLAPYNIMQFDFQYGLAVAGGTTEDCKSVVPISNRVEIDPNSTIDFSGLYHFAKLPNLNLFTVSGFPFTKYADLQETAVLIPLNAPSSVITTFLNTMARLSSQTGAPATKLTVLDHVDKSILSDKDILVFAETSSQIEGLQKMDPNLTLEQIQNKIQEEFASNVYQAPGSYQIDENAGVAAIVQFESPYSSNRSVIALFGDGQDGSQILNSRMMYPLDLKLVGGSVAILKPNLEPASYEVGPAYYTGSLPWHQRVWYAMLDQPLLLVLFTLVCALLIAGGIYYLMHSLIRARGRRHK
ncbi:MAG: cellulose biosynthesis cyclic di-GMP-binding regulatory protein BcsB, partial [Burkholderiales bacterium]|nr:cellulose biosynthesis cyclic di-GMP-binding regulatory protein BcsB [Burkholderiales bacterium]